MGCVYLDISYLLVVLAHYLQPALPVLYQFLAKICRDITEVEDCELSDVVLVLHVFD